MSPDVTRRTVLSAGAGLAGLAVIAAAPGVANAATPAAGPLRSHYARSVGKTFTVQAHGRVHTVTLTAIHDLAPTTAMHRPFCFRLMFTPSGHIVLPEGIYTVRRAGVVTHSLLLSSTGSRAMQAVVNNRR